MPCKFNARVTSLDSLLRSREVFSYQTINIRDVCLYLGETHDFLSLKEETISNGQIIAQAASNGRSAAAERPARQVLRLIFGLTEVQGQLGDRLQSGRCYYR